VLSSGSAVHSAAGDGTTDSYAYISVQLIDMDMKWDITSAIYSDR
jgi:hypothetical protein